VAPTAEIRSVAPAPRLRHVVDRYVCYRTSGFPPWLHRGLPSGHLTFIVSIGAPVEVVRQCDPSQSPGAYRVVVGGLQDVPALVVDPGTQEGIAVQLNPMGARAVLGHPAGRLANLSLELSDLVGPVGDRLWEEVQEAGSWSGRVAACDRVLSSVLGDVGADPTLWRAWSLLVASGGSSRVDELAREVGWSRQHLTRRFRDELGFGPKVLGRVLRFSRARDTLRATRGEVPLAVLAADCGYADQSHLHRDFSAFAGCSPQRWLVEEVPSIHDDGSPDGAGSSP
jgi:AraC-like DNA-binding protein